jgi:hypothetical protein
MSRQSFTAGSAPLQFLEDVAGTPGPGGILLLAAPLA